MKTFSDGNGPYIHGHHEAVLRSHRWRTIENSASYLKSFLSTDSDLLDVGCGPGTLTCEFGLHSKSVVGIDQEPEIITEAQNTAGGRGVKNSKFKVGDAYALDFADNTFDIVHAHQVLQHLAMPIDALSEMRRVGKPGGIIAVRDSDYGAMTWFPELPGLDRWKVVYSQVARSSGGEPDAGRHLVEWVRRAGLENMTVTSSTWSFVKQSERAWWADLWADRVSNSRFAELAIDGGFSDRVELAEISRDWRDWADHNDACFFVPHVEVIAHL